jgi:hypothetical protein
MIFKSIVHTVPVITIYSLVSPTESLVLILKDFYSYIQFIFKYLKVTYH